MSSADSMTHAPALAQPSRSAAWWYAFFAAALIVYISWVGYFGRFFHGDEIFYKAAGRQWAQSGKFAAPELVGWVIAGPPVDQIFLAYPPAYMFLFGLYTRLFGFGWNQIMLFDPLIHVGLAVITFVTVRNLVKDSPIWLAAITGLAIIPLGLLGRPDELSTCFGMASFVLLLSSPLSFWRVALAAGLFGLTIATSIGGAIVMGPVAFFLLLMNSEPWPRRIREILIFGLVALVTFGAALAPILVAYPSAYLQFTPRFHEDHGGILKTWDAFMQLGLTLSIFPYFAALAIALLSCAISRQQEEWRRWVRLWAGPLLGMALVFFGIPGKLPYFWFVGPWLLVTSAVCVYSMRLTRLRVIGGALLAFGLFVGAIPFAKDIYVLCSLPESQTMQAAANVLRSLIPDGSTVLTTEYWPLLGNRCRVYDASFSEPSPRTIDYIVVTGNGSGVAGKRRPVKPGSMIGFEDYIQEHFTVIYDNLAKEPVSLLGRRLTHSGYGFGPIVLKQVRQNPMSATPPSNMGNP